ncbi:hypothetical protein J6590_035386 [Homalodisca vitripennis]|nr:hypothetical protein J6590_035386 [Homalodisca vitripennis]
MMHAEANPFTARFRLAALPWPQRDPGTARPGTPHSLNCLLKYRLHFTSPAVLPGFRTRKATNTKLFK